MSEKATIIGDAEEMSVDDLPMPTSLRDHDTAERRNTERGLFAGVGIAAYTEHVSDLGEPLEQQASDFLGDLMHLCDATGMDFESLVDRGRFHYLAEITGEG